MKKDVTLGTIVVVFMTVFTYKIGDVLTRHTHWWDFTEPVGVGELLICAAMAFGAVGCAMGIDFGNLWRGLGLAKKDGEPV